MNEENGHEDANHNYLVLRVVLDVVQGCGLEPPYDYHQRVRREAIGVEVPVAFLFPLLDHQVEEEAEEK